MATVKCDFRCDLTKPIKVEYLDGNMFTLDNGGNTINVYCYEGEEPATLGGSVSANVIRPDGTTVPVSGAIDGNKAYVILPQAAYAVPGHVTIIIKVTQSTTVTTIAAVVANNMLSSTDTIVDPGTIIPSVQDLIAQIETAVGSIPADYSALLATLAADYSSSKTYAVGDYAWQAGVLKRCIVPITTAETYTAAHWTNAVLGDDLSALKSALSIVNDSVTDEKTIAWTDAGTTNYPNGWAGGYYNKDTGEAQASNVYIRSNAQYWFWDVNATILEVTAPNGYHIAVYEYQSNGTFVKRHGDQTENGTTKLFINYEKGHKFHFALGRFTNEQDSIDHYSDASFINSCVAKFMTVKVDVVSDDLNWYIEDGNNIAPLDDYVVTYRGITFAVKNGVLTLSGTSTGVIRAKFSNGYEMSGSAEEKWKSETLPQFEVGKTYSIHNIIISGTLPSDIGVSLRGSDGSTVIGASSPEATIESVPAYLMMYVPSGRTLNVSYIPAFIEGGVGTIPVYKRLNPLIQIESGYSMPDLSKSFIYDSEYQSAMKFPASYKPTGKPTPMIILGHGLSSTISASTWGGTDMMTLVNKFIAEGFAVIDVNQVTTQDWCNPALIKKYVSAIQSATEKYNVVPVIVFGESMGSLIGLCLATLYNVKVCVISGIRLDLAARYAEMSSANKAIVDSNIGFTDGYDANIAAGWDKTAISAVTQDGEKVCPCDFPPTFFIVGSADTLTKAESLAKVAEIKRGGTICKTTEYTGDHNDVCYLKTGTSFEDAVEWIRQWL